MIILNDNRFNDETFYKVSNIEEILSSSKNSTIIFKYNKADINLYKFCKEHNIEFAVEINSVEEFIFLINLNAKYALVDNLKLAKTLQKLADNYLTQTKIIVKSSIKNIENIAMNEIDGIFVL
jgi:nicotinate-nucleotide pyrophosphorylase